MKKNNLFFLIIISFFFVDQNLLAEQYRGAEYRTHDAFLYGRFEVRYKPANREGVVSSFFTYHEIEKTTGWNEIDFEFIGRYQNSIQFNAITPQQKFHIRTQHINFDPYGDFHDYAFEWTPDYVAWFIDGEEVYRQTGDHIATLQYPQKIMMNIWNPIYTGWVGYFNNAFLPVASTYDYIKYSSYTPSSGNYGTDNNFTFEWRDDLDSLDSNRWVAATHTFAGNLATFDPDNIVFKNGYMYLYLTNETDKSGIDNLAPSIMWARANYDSSISIKLSEEISRESGENKSNFILPGGEITNAALSENNLYVKLSTKNYNIYELNNLIYSGLTDLSYNSNKSSTQVALISKVDTIHFPIKVNVGGGTFNGYLPDQEWSNNLQYGYWMGDARSISSNVDILSTEEDEIFRSYRKGLVTYKFKLPVGNYKISFLLADNNNNNPGEGIFNIYAEKQLVKNNIDLIAAVGKNAAYQIDSEIFVEDGILDIFFEEQIDSAFVNGIIIDRILTNIISSNQSNFIDNFRLYQNYPNPFNGETHINYFLPKSSETEFRIYNILGSQIYYEKLGIQSSGNHSFIWDGKNFQNKKIISGIYFYQIIADNFIQSKKMIYLK